MRKLIEIIHVSLGGVVGPSVEWARPYLGDEHQAYAEAQLFDADALVLGRLTYEDFPPLTPRCRPARLSTA